MVYLSLLNTFTYLLFLLTFSTIAIIHPQEAHAGEPPLKIGVIASLTGRGASRGESARLGIELAYEQLISRGMFQDGDLQFIYQDVALNKPALAASAAHQLINTERVVAIIGPMGSSPSSAAAPIIDRAHIPAITHTSSSPTALAGTTYLFRLWPTGKSYAQIIAHRLFTLQYRRIGILTATHDSPIDLRDFLKKELTENPSHHIEVAYDEEFTAEETDFRSSLLKLSKLNLDAIFLNLFEGQIGVAAKQASELGLNVPLFTNAVMSDLELKTSPHQLEKIWFPRFTGYTNVGMKRFIRKFGKEPPNSESAAAAHDALIVIAEALSHVGRDPKKIRDYIRAKDTFHGVTGDFSFLANGDATVTIGLHVVRHGKITSLP